MAVIGVTREPSVGTEPEGVGAGTGRTEATAARSVAAP